MQADTKRSALGRILACILTVIVLVGMMPEQIITAIAESNDNGFELTLSWNKIEDNCLDPNDPGRFVYDSDKEETRLVRLKVAYSNKQVSRAFEAGEITITVPGLKGAVRSGVSYIPDIAADKADVPMDEKQYDWSYTYTSATDTYTFTNNKPIPTNSTFEGSFELVWKLPSRETKDGYEGKLTAELFTSEANVISNTLTYTQTRKCDEYTVIEEPSPLFNETLPIDDHMNYIWVKYDITGSDTYYARDIDSPEVFELYFLEGAQIFWLDGDIHDTGRTENIDGKDYHVWSVINNITADSDPKYISNVFAAYPRDTFGKAPYYGNGGSNELLKSIVKIKGTYYEEEEAEILAENNCEINLQDYDFSNVPGPIYEVTKHSYGIHMDSIDAHDDYCKEHGAINSVNLSDEKGEYLSAFQLELFYTIDGVEILDDGSVLSKSYQPADSYRLEFVDDIIDVQTKDGSFRQLRDDEYAFTEVRIPSNKEITNANGHPIKADTYTVEIYVRRAERDSEGSLIQQCNNGTAAAGSEPRYNGNFETQPYKTGKITGSEWTVDLPEDTVGVKVVVLDLAESWFTDEIHTIRCGYKFHTDDEDIMTAGGQIMNNMHFNLIGTKGDTVLTNYDQFSYVHYGEDQSGTADNRQYLRDVEIYGHALDRDSAVTHIIEIPNEFKLDSTRIDLDRSVSGNEDGLDNGAYYFNGEIVSKFTLGEGTQLSDFSIYTIVPEGLKLTENADDPTSLLNALTFYSSGGYSSAYIASHTAVEIISDPQQYNGRQYIAFHFDFSDDPITTKTLSISGIPMYVFKHNLNYGSVSYTMHAEMMVDQPGKWYSNGIDNSSMENGIWADIDRDGNTSELASFASGYVELTNKESFHMELTKYVQTPLTNGIVNPKPEEVTDSATGMAAANAPKTYAGGEYSYFLYATVVSGVANHMVFADVIEPGGTSDWQGEFVGVDYSQIVKQLTYPDGVKKEPTIYYSSNEEEFTKTVDGKTLIDQDAFQSGGWTTQKPDTVRSIAVDFGEGQIESGMDMVLEIKMKAPADVHNCYKLATNSCSIGYNWINKTSGESDYPDFLSSNTVPVTYVPPGKITLTKKDEVSGINITGAKFKLYKEADGGTDTLIGEYETNKNGMIIADTLDYGKYYFVETEAPAGYEISNDKFEVMVSEDAPSVSIVFNNKRKTGQFTITKISDRTQNPIGGAEFQLYNANGTLIGDAAYETDPSGQLTVSGLAWGRYYLLESKAPKGYYLSDERIEFEINAQTVEAPESKTVENEQKPANATLVKCELAEEYEYDAVTESTAIGNTPIKGAVYRLCDAAGKQISVGVTDADGKIYAENLTFGEYYFEEVSAAMGYEKYPEKIRFTVDADATERDLVIYTADTRKTGNVWMQKLDDAKEPVKDAVYRLYNGDGELMAVSEVNSGQNDGKYRFVSGKSGSYDMVTSSEGVIEIEAMQWGDYYIQEAEAPTGYELDEARHEFSIGRANVADTVILYSTDPRIKGRVELTKVDEADETKLLEGAVFTLYRSDNTVYRDNIITGDDGKALIEDLEWGSYYLKEKTAPAGYSVSSRNIKFSVNYLTAGKVQEITVTNPQKTYKLTVNKEIYQKDIVLSHGNPTFIFKVTSGEENGETYYRSVSFGSSNITPGDESYAEASAIFTLPPGTYTVEEISTDRYTLSEITLSEGTLVNEGKAAQVTLGDDSGASPEITVSFKNDKTDQSGTSHNSSIANMFSKSRVLTAIVADYQGPKTLTDENIPTDNLTVYAVYDDGTQKTVNTYTLDPEKLSFENNGSFDIEVSYEEGGIVRKDSFNVNVDMPSPFTAKFVKPNGDGTYSVVNEPTEITIDGTTYRGLVAITGYYGSSSVVNFPATLSGYIANNGDAPSYVGETFKVVQIGDNTSFVKGMNGKTAITFAEGIEVISNKAFNNYASVECTVKFPDTLKRIGQQAFNSCSKMHGALVIPDSVEYIGSNAFYYCSAFEGEGLTLPKNLTYIGNGAFWGCSGMKGDLTIPAKVTDIYGDTFRQCGFNGNLIFENGSSLASIGDYAFYNVPFSGDLAIPDGVTSIGEYAFYSGRQSSGTSTNSFNGGQLTLPGNLKTIGQYAFYGCKFAGGLTIPSGVTEIGECAFHECTGFDGNLIFAKDSQLTSIGKGAFGATWWNNDGPKFTGNLELPESLKTIGESAFYKCDFTGSLTIPNSVTSIGAYAFRECDFDGALTFAAGCQLTEIKNHTFWDVPFSGNLNIPEGVTSVGEEAFQSANGIISFSGGTLTLPDTLTSIGKQAFYECEFGGQITLPDGLTAISDFAFYRCNYVTGDLVIPRSVTSIGEQAFFLDTWSAGTIESITFENGSQLKSIGRQAFHDQSKITTLALPEGLEVIGEEAFVRCRGLQTLTLPSTLKTIGSYAFSACENLACDLTIPPSVEVIENQAFNMCTKLKGHVLTIPKDNSLTKIGYGAFYMCFFDSDLGDNMKSQIWIPININHADDQKKNIAVDTSYYYGNGDANVDSGIINTSQMEAGNDIFYGYQIKYGFFQRGS